MPPKRMRLAEVPDYIEGVHGGKVSKMTVYNWTNKGIGGEKLKYVMGKSKPTRPFPDIRLTTAEWVNDFLRRARATFG